MKHIFDKYHVITKNILKMRTVPCKGLCYIDKDIHDKNIHTEEKQVSQEKFILFKNDYWEEYFLSIYSFL